jgi:hypothetical protein
MKLKAQSSKLKAQSSKLKAQSSKLCHLTAYLKFRDINQQQKPFSFQLSALSLTLLLK